MLSVHVENVGCMALIECKGIIVGSEEAAELHTAVTLQEGMRTIVLDLTEIDAVERSGLSMLESLQMWAVERGIQFKLFNPISAVENTLEHDGAVRFCIAPVEEVIALMAALRVEAAEEAARVEAARETDARGVSEG